MTETERELDMALAEAEQENRKLRSDNERLESEKQELENILAVERMAIRDMGTVLVDYEQLIADMADRIKQLEGHTQ